MMQKSTLNNNRYSTVDCLRGIAALAVVLYHLAPAAFSDPTSAELSTCILSIAKLGYLGVAIFFVVSGFVIAASVKHTLVSFTYIKKYIIKRSLRLDPPYWLSIAVHAALVYATIFLLGIEQVTPTLRQIIAHIFYMQDLLRYGNITNVYWTLCLEVQNYIFFCLVFAIANLPAPDGLISKLWKYFPAVVFSASVLYSLLISGKLLKSPLPGIFFPYWYLFMIGATAYWVGITKELSQKYFVLLMLATLLASINVANNFEYVIGIYVGMATGLFLVVAALKARLSVWLRSGLLLYLGRISYSLYLFHTVVGEQFIHTFQRILAPKFGWDLSSDLASFALLIFSVLFCVAISHCVYMLLEKPSMQISKDIKPADASGLWLDIKTSLAKNGWGVS